jgi:hypothetical protein
MDLGVEAVAAATVASTFQIQPPFQAIAKISAFQSR